MGDPGQDRPAATAAGCRLRGGGCGGSRPAGPRRPPLQQGHTAPGRPQRGALLAPGAVGPAARGAGPADDRLVPTAAQAAQAAGAPAHPRLPGHRALQDKKLHGVEEVPAPRLSRPFQVVGKLGKEQAAPREGRREPLQVERVWYRAPPGEPARAPGREGGGGPGRLPAPPHRVPAQPPAPESPGRGVPGGWAAARRFGRQPVCRPEGEAGGQKFEPGSPRRRPETAVDLDVVGDVDTSTRVRGQDRVELEEHEITPRGPLTREGRSQGGVLRRPGRYLPLPALRPLSATGRGAPAGRPPAG